MFIVAVSRINLMLEFHIPAWVSCRIRVCFRVCNVVDLEMQDCEWDLSRWGFALEPEGFAADIRGERIPCKFWSLCFILIDSEFKCRDLSIIFTDPICVKASFDVKHAKSSRTNTHFTSESEYKLQYDIMVNLKATKWSWKLWAEKESLII